VRAVGHQRWAEVCHEPSLDELPQGVKLLRRPVVIIFSSWVEFDLQPVIEFFRVIKQILELGSRAVPEVAMVVRDTHAKLRQEGLRLDVATWLVVRSLILDNGMFRHSLLYGFNRR